MELRLKLTSVFLSHGYTDWLKWNVHQVDGQMWAVRQEEIFLKMATSLDLSKDTCESQHPENLLAARLPL